MTFQQTVQSLSFLLFVLLLWQAGFPLDSILPVDLFLRLDPLVFLGTAVSSRTLNASALLALPVIALTMVLGRFTCSTLCPMGITIDIADRVFADDGGHRAPAPLPARLRPIKYEILLFVLAVALLGGFIRLSRFASSMDHALLWTHSLPGLRLRGGLGTGDGATHRRPLGCDQPCLR